MPRPARAQMVPRTYARRRHRSWMLSMTLASLGWGCWWTVLFLRRFAPALDPGNVVPGALATAFAVVGFLLAIVTVRARRSWLLLTLVPLGANGSLLVMPWLAEELARPE